MIMRILSSCEKKGNDTHWRKGRRRGEIRVGKVMETEDDRNVLLLLVFLILFHSSLPSSSPATMTLGTWCLVLVVDGVREALLSEGKGEADRNRHLSVVRGEAPPPSRSVR